MILCSLLYTSSDIQIKTVTKGVDNSMWILKFPWKCKRPRRAKTILKNKVGELTLPNVMSYYKALLLKNKHRLVEQNRGPRNK
jgi:hypothetical protein